MHQDALERKMVANSVTKHQFLPVVLFWKDVRFFVFTTSLVNIRNLRKYYSIARPFLLQIYPFFHLIEDFWHFIWGEFTRLISLAIVYEIRGIDVFRIEVDWPLNRALIYICILPVDCPYILRR